MVDTHTFVDNGITHTFYFSGNTPILGTKSNETASIPQSTTGTIYLPNEFIFESKTYQLTHIGQYSFINTNIQQLIFSSNVKYLYSTACEYIPYVELIDLSQTQITELLGYTFSRCYNLKRLLLPGTIQKISLKDFKDTRSLKFIEISSKLLSLNEDFCTPNCGLQTIYYCGSIYNGLEFPNNINISRIIVPRNYEGEYFGNMKVNKTSFNCYYERTKCFCKKMSFLPLIHLFNFCVILSF